MTYSYHKHRVHSSVYLTRVMMLLVYVGLILVMFSSSGSGRLSKACEEDSEGYPAVSKRSAGHEDLLHSLLLHLIKYPRRLNRAEAKSENYNLRANYIPRLGKKSHLE